MSEINLSEFPIMNLIIHYNRAIENEFWLEAIVLAHMYVETQLRKILEFDDFRKKPKTIPNEKVIELAKQAYNKRVVNKQLLRKIESFNKSRNDAVHNLTVGIISYEDLKATATSSDQLIGELRELEEDISSRRTN